MAICMCTQDPRESYWWINGATAYNNNIYMKWRKKQQQQTKTAKRITAPMTVVLFSSFPFSVNKIHGSTSMEQQNCLSFTCASAFSWIYLDDTLYFILYIFTWSCVMSTHLHASINRMRPKPKTDIQTHTFQSFIHLVFNQFTWSRFLCT